MNDGTQTATGIYVEQENHGMHEVVKPFRVQHGGELYSGLSPLSQHIFGKPTANGKFTEVIINGQTIYSESHPGRAPNA